MSDQRRERRRHYGRRRALTSRVDVEQLKLDATAQMTKLERLYHNDMLTSTMFYAKILVDFPYFIYSSLFTDDNWDSQTEDDSSPFLFLFFMVLYSILYVIIPYKVAGYRAQQKVKAIVDVGTKDAKALDKIPVRKLKKINDELASEIKLVSSQSDRKFYLALCVCIGSYFTIDVCKNAMAEVDRTADQALQFIREIKKQPFDKISRALSIANRLRVGKQLSSADRMYARSSEFPKLLEYANQLGRQAKILGIDKLYRHIVSDIKENAKRKILALSIADSVIPFTGFYSFHIAIIHFFLKLKDMYNNYNADSYANAQLQHLNAILENKVSAQWRMQGDGISRVRLFVLTVRGNATYKKMFFEEMQEFCQFHKLRVAIITRNKLAVFLPGIKAAQVKELKSDLNNQLKEKEAINRHARNQLNCLNQLTQSLVRSEWEFTIARNGSIPIAHFTLDIRGYNTVFIAQLNHQLSNLLGNTKITINDNTTVSIEGIDSTNTKDQTIFKNANQELEDQLFPKSTSLSGSLHEDSDKDESLRTQHQPPKRTKKSRTQQVLTAMAAVPRFFSFSRKPKQPSWDYKGRHITSDPGKPITATNARLLRNSLCNTPLIYAIISPDIWRKKQGNQLLRNQLALLDLLNMAKFVGAYGSGIKYCSDGEFSYKVKKSKGFGKNLGLFARTISEKPGTVLLQFYTFKRRH